MRKLVLVLGIGIIATGCGGGGGGGGGGLGTGNAAIDATLTPLFASMRTGSANLDPSITNGTVGNPLKQSSSSATNTVNIGGAANDGTVTSVSVSVSVTPNTDGSSKATATVAEATTSFQFLSVTETINAPGLSVSVPQGGLSGLKSDGSGHAFVVLRVTTNGTLSRTFNNTSSSSKTLVSFGTVTPVAAAGTLSSNLSGFQDFLIDYIITVGPLSAKINSIQAGSSQSTSTRPNGPLTSPLTLTFSQLSVGSTNPPLNADAIIPVGSDSGLPNPVAGNAAVAMTFAISNGIQGTTPSTDVKDNITPSIGGSNASPITYSGALNNLPNVGDGVVQIDKTVRAESSESESVTSGGSVKSSLDGNIGSFGNLKDVLYLPNAVDVRRVLYLIR